MKPLLIVITGMLCACQVTTVTRELPDGSKETVVTKGLSDRAASTGLLIGDRLLDRYLGPDGERGSK
jgi:hypothetical protein